MEAELSIAAQFFLAASLAIFFISFFGILICMARDAEGPGGFFVLTGATSIVALIIFGIGHL